MKILTSADIRSLEKSTIDKNTTAKNLMEEAGRQSFLYFQKNLKSLSATKIIICCGPGNNGGDGLVLARYFLEYRAQIAIYILSTKPEFKTQEAKDQLRALESKNPLIHWISDEKAFNVLEDPPFKPDWIIDAVFGIGLDQPLKGIYAQYVQWVEKTQRETQAQVCSLDIPTGLNADTGESMGASVRADVTLSFEFYKKGFYQRDGLVKCGQIFRMPIGIGWDEKIVKNKYYSSIESSTLPTFPRIGRQAHKNKRGHALVIAGSKEKSGAAVLASLACARAGVGLSTLAVPSAAHDLIKSQLINVMSEEIPSDSKSRFDSTSVDVVGTYLKGKTAFLIGPGLAPDKNRKKWIQQLMVKAEIPLVIDAQALSDLEGDMPSLVHCVITPHPGEMSRLTGLTTEEIQANRFEIIEKYSRKWNITIVLKGHNTLVGFPNGDVWVNQVDHPCLSVAGTGDVLSGILVSFLAQGIPIEDATKLAVYVHGRAGQRLGQRTGIRGIVASDLLTEIPQVIHEIDTDTAA